MTSGSAAIAAWASRSLACHSRSSSRSVASRGTAVEPIGRGSALLARVLHRPLELLPVRQPQFKRHLLRPPGPDHPAPPLAQPQRLRDVHALTNGGRRAREPLALPEHRQARAAERRRVTELHLVLEEALAVGGELGAEQLGNPYHRRWLCGWWQSGRRRHRGGGSRKCRVAALVTLCGTYRDGAEVVCGRRLKARDSRGDRHRGCAPSETSR